MTLTVIGTSLDDVWSPTGSIDDLLDATGDVDCCCEKGGCCRGQITFPLMIGDSLATIFEIEVIVANAAAVAAGITVGLKVDGNPISAGFWLACLATSVLFPITLSCSSVDDEEAMELTFDPAYNSNCSATGTCPTVDLKYNPVSASCNPVQFDFEIDFSSELVGCDPAIGFTVRVTKKAGSP